MAINTAHNNGYKTWQISTRWKRGQFVHTSLSGGK